MNRPKNSQKPAEPAEPPIQVKKPVLKSAEDDEYSFTTLWLLFYNWLSAILWTAILVRVSLALAMRGYEHVYDDVGYLVKWTQTFAILEMTHSAFKMVRAPLLTTTMQVASRFFLVWIIVDQYPHLAQISPAYSSMLLAWSATEVIRYSYFTAALLYGAAPDALKWLRYNTFILLYPLGIASEVWMVCLALEPARQVAPFWEQALYGVLALYGPGAYVLFTHMLKQRTKVLAELSKKKKTA